jgi:alpha-galactosidase
MRSKRTRNRRRPLQICIGLLLGFVPVSCHRPGTAELHERQKDEFLILTPRSPETPQIHGAKVFGVRPNSPFLFQIAATGKRPIEYSALGLPASLQLDKATGQITGVLGISGSYPITLRAENSLGATERQLLVIAGDRVALTPPMGWNSWNCWGVFVTQERVLRAGQALVASGLRDHGWSYINIDDGWQGKRGGPFNGIQGNSSFPDMGALVVQIHEMGLKAGIYSTPWKTSFVGHIGSSANNADGSYNWIGTANSSELCQYLLPEDHTIFDGYAFLKPLSERIRKRMKRSREKELRTFGKFSFTAQDVAQWVAWGFDYLKYDWSPIDVAHAAEMSRALLASPRDIVYSVAKNSRTPLAADLQRLSNCSRSTVDLEDTWESVSMGFFQDKWAPYNRPGHFNDPDMLVVGMVGLGKPRGTPKPTRLTSDEQYTHISLWCLMSAPLLLGCDLEQLDDFTLGLLTNDEVLDIDQDSLGRQATRVSWQGDSAVFAKPLADGSLAVGLFNRGDVAAKITVNWPELGIKGTRRIRDLWRQKDVGVFSEKFDAIVAPHGVVLVTLTSVKQE